MLKGVLDPVKEAAKLQDKQVGTALLLAWPSCRLQCYLGDNFHSRANRLQFQASPSRCGLACAQPLVGCAQARSRQLS